MGGMKFGAGEFIEGLERLLDDWVGGGADRQGNKDFAKVEIGFFEIGGFVFDFEDRFEDGGSDEVYFVGYVADGFEGVQKCGGGGREVICLATDDVLFADFETGTGKVARMETFFGGHASDKTILF